jgi:uncharacterized cupin superfamily protein
MVGKELDAFPVHLGRGGNASTEPIFTGDADWYASYETRHSADARDGRLVSAYTFDKPWQTWEMHPAGAEVVVCISGEVTLLQEQKDGAIVAVRLISGQYVINEPGVWHTADVDAPTALLFITPGAGTEIRER